MYWERRSVYRILVGELTEGDHLQDAGVDVRIIYQWIFRRWVGGYGLIELLQDRDKWRAVVNAVMNLRVP
jgi:hypothetical protein